ncbi:MAG: hypothetical protein EOP34_11245 [Rickettsiales bacterium]|nr:MAG: hypothetical protein EOP34_11245 [Rickettsiales bacterium]
MQIAMKNMLKLSTILTTVIALNTGVSFAGDTGFITKFRIFGAFPEEKQTLRNKTMMTTAVTTPAATPAVTPASNNPTDSEINDVSNAGTPSADNTTSPTDNTTPPKDNTTSPATSSVDKVLDKVFKTGYGAELSGAYFFNTNIAAEVSFGVHAYEYESDAYKDVASFYKNTDYTSASDKTQRSFFMPLTGTLQFHVDPSKEFSPYVGAGGTYMFSYNPDDTVAKVSDMKGLVLQAGFDINSKDGYGFNVDMKKFFTKDGDIKYNDKIVGNTVKSAVSDFEYNPIIVGIGFTIKDVI